MNKEEIEMLIDEGYEDIEMNGESVSHNQLIIELEKKSISP